MSDEEDDEYYDDEEEDEEYEDEEEGAAKPASGGSAEGGGKGPMIFAAIVGVLALAIVGVAIKFLSGGDKDAPKDGEVGDLEGASPAPAGDAAAAAGSAAPVELGSSFDFDSILGDTAGGATPAGGSAGGSTAGGAAGGSGSAAGGSGSAAAGGGGSGSGGSSYGGSTGSSSGGGSGSTGSSGSSSYGGSSSGSGSSASASTDGRSSGGSSSGGSSSGGSSSGGSSSGGSSSGGSSSGGSSSGGSSSGYREGQIVEDPTPSRGKKEEATPAPKKEEATPAPKKEESTPAPKKEESTPAPKKEESTPAPAEVTNLDYEKSTLAALGSKASSGSLSAGELGHLQSVPGDHPNYTTAWAAVMANAESKRDYKGHCSATDKIMEKPGNRYHPEYNLERAKCQMRNNDLGGAIESVDRTVGNSYDMNPSSKTARLLLAYEIKARCRTKLYDDNAKANAGMGDEGKLNAAIQAWNEFKNYAAGIGNQAALQKCEREIADLEARRAG